MHKASQSSPGRFRSCVVMWDGKVARLGGNVGVNKETGESLPFDARSYFAYSEMEVGHWRCEVSYVFRSRLYTRH